MSKSPLRIAVLLSGGGRSLQNLLDLRTAGKLDIDVRLVVGSKPALGGLDRATRAGISTDIVVRKDHPALESFSDRIFSLVEAAQVDLVCLAGWLFLLKLPGSYTNRVMNIHPALLPSFGGKGMYGNRVHQAVIDYGCKVSGCTVHFSDNTYDTGPVILQRTCPVLDDDTPETLARRVFDEECVAYPEAVRLFAEGRLEVRGRRVVTRGADLAANG